VLDAFEHAIALPVELGLFFFTAANAGAPLDQVSLTLTQTQTLTQP
jgi:hypothetical protein